MLLLLLLLFFLLGAGYADEGELTSDDQEYLNEMYRVAIRSVPKIVDRQRRGVDMEPTISRILHNDLAAYNYAFISVDREDDDLLLSWEYGDTIDHCSDCSSYVAMGPQPKPVWRDIAANRGHYPQSPNLSCTGLNCDCRYTNAS